jgi:Kef-type K+ transport system membrane component KefB
VAQIGLGLAVISPQFFAAVLFMAVATTLVAPPLIKFFFVKDHAAEENEAQDEFSRIG